MLCVRWSIYPLYGNYIAANRGSLQNVILQIVRKLDNLGRGRELVHHGIEQTWPD